MSPIYHLTERKAISERTKAALAAAKARDTACAAVGSISITRYRPVFLQRFVLEAAVELNSKYSTVLIIEAASHES
jgi:hypothetical protein